MAVDTLAGPITRLDRIWLLAPFQKTFHKRSRELNLVQQLGECVRHLWTDPTSPGLNLETIDHAGNYAVLSARITQQFRLILVQLGPREVGLVHFDNHDEAYAWAKRNLGRIPTWLARTQEVARGCGLPGGPLPLRPTEEPEPLALQGAEEFSRLLASGAERYLAYLDDDQKRLVEIPARGLLLVKGGAGTGKTAVAVHRLVALLRQPSLLTQRPVLYLCYNLVLGRAVEDMIRTIFDEQWPAGLEVATLHTWCLRYLRLAESCCDNDKCRQVFQARVWPELQRRCGESLSGVDPPLLWDEITRVIKGCNLTTEQEYLDFNRKGRGFPLKQEARRQLWWAYEKLQTLLAARRRWQWEDLPNLALAALSQEATFAPYRAVVVDEGQDFSLAMLRLARQLAGGAEGELTVLADPTQEVYQRGFQWALRELKPVGGSVRWLRRNYRSTRQIYAVARALIAGCGDLEEDLAAAQLPLREGDPPTLLVAADVNEELEEICQRVLQEAAARPAAQIALIAAHRATLARLNQRLVELGVPTTLAIDAEKAKMHVGAPTVKLLTIYSAKGLDFPVVFFVQLTAQALKDRCGDDPNTARRTVYTAFTRASLKLCVSTVFDRQHPLLEECGGEHWQFAGSHGREFANLYATN